MDWWRGGYYFLGGRSAPALQPAQAFSRSAVLLARGAGLSLPPVGPPGCCNPGPCPLDVASTQGQPKCYETALMQVGRQVAPQDLCKTETPFPDQLLKPRLSDPGPGLPRLPCGRKVTNPDTHAGRSSSRCWRHSGDTGTWGCCCCASARCVFSWCLSG